MISQSIEKKPWWRKISIRNKLRFTIIGFSLLAFIFFTIGITLTANSYFHYKMRKDLTILANVFAENTRAAVVFNDSSSAITTLSSLSKNPNIIKAIIFKNNNKFAIYPDKAQVTKEDLSNKTGIWLLDGKYYISVPIVVTGQEPVKLLLVSDLKEWQDVKYSLYIIFASIFIGLILLTSFISIWLESTITKPLQDISDWAIDITKTNNFSIRTGKKNDDEIGKLIDSLNTMLTALLKQESIIALNKKLTNEIHERENAEKSLIVMRDKAEAANQAKSMFLANMSHEIRTPLNGIIGMIPILLRTKIDTTQRSYLDIIKQSGDSLLTIINEILDFSKMESGKITLEISEFNLRSLIDDIIIMLGPLAHTKGLTIGAVTEASVPNLIMSDPTRIRQVLTNLLGNAIKFTDKGEVELNIKLEKSKTANANSQEIILRFEVRDTGIGISPETRSHLFQVFSQGDNSTSRKYGGTGLGLVISKRLVESMGGEMDVVNCEPRGCKFWFTILAISSGSKNMKENKVRGNRLLVVDENSMNRRIIKQQVESFNMRCDTAANGAEAIEKLQAAANGNDPYFLCLIDYEMAEMGGFKLAEKIRNISIIARTPLIMMSSLGQSLPDDAIKRLEIVNCMTKPIQQSSLLDNIMLLMDAQKSIETTTLTEKETKGELHAEKILLAEDYLINQTVALATLDVLGYHADVANNGLEVLSALKNKSYDIILMDCQMPEMDGYTTTRKIRELEKGTSKHITIIAMTAHALEGESQKCKDAGMDDYISKPIDIQELERILKRWQVTTSA